ncbi:MAG: hypothetical protein E6873_10215, partial [Cutibacterium avidum]|nr:hypothetical protein [Cutibacterium avidum]
RENRHPVKARPTTAAMTPAHQVTKIPSTTARATVRMPQVRQTMSLLTVTNFGETGCHSPPGGLKSSSTS